MAVTMATDFRVRCGTPRHRKFKTLISRFGKAAGWAVVELWDYTADQFPGGILGPLSNEALGSLVWDGPQAAEFGSALIEIGLAERDGQTGLAAAAAATGVVEVHDWLIEQPHIAKLAELAEARIRGGRNAAKLRREATGTAIPCGATNHPGKRTSADTSELAAELKGMSLDGSTATSSKLPPGFARAPVPDLTGPDHAKPDLTGRDPPARPPAPAIHPIHLPPTPVHVPGTHAQGEGTKDQPPPPRGGKPGRLAEFFGRGMPHAQGRSPDVAQVLNAWAIVFKRVTGEAPTEDAGTTGEVERLLQQHEASRIAIRMLHYEAHHRAGTFACETFTLRQFTRDFDKFAVGPVARDPKGKPVRTIEEDSAKTRALLEQYGIGEESKPTDKLALKSAEGSSDGNQGDA